MSSHRSHSRSSGKWLYLKGNNYWRYTHCSLPYGRNGSHLQTPDLLICLGLQYNSLKHMRIFNTPPFSEPAPQVLSSMNDVFLKWLSCTWHSQHFSHSRDIFLFSQSHRMHGTDMFAYIYIYLPYKSPK